jgi:hypothetical protein
MGLHVQGRARALDQIEVFVNPLWLAQTAPTEREKAQLLLDLRELSDATLGEQLLDVQVVRRQYLLRGGMIQTSIWAMVLPLVLMDSPRYWRHAQTEPELEHKIERDCRAHVIYSDLEPGQKPLDVTSMFVQERLYCGGGGAPL